MRIILITFFSVLALSILIYMARIWGLGQNHPQYESPFFNGPQPTWIVQATNNQEIQSLTTKNQDYVIWLDVRLSGDKIPFILSPSKDKAFLDQIYKEQTANPQQKIMIGNKVSEYPLSELERFYGVLPTLKDIYEKFPQTKFILNVIDNTHEVHIAVTKAIESFNPNHRTMIQSEALIILKSIKEIRPEFIYGTSTPDIMRFLVMDSMWILPSTQFKGDVYVAPFKVQNRPAFNENIIAEVRRRNKRIYLGPITTAEELSYAQKIKADGYIINNLEEFLKLPHQGPAQ